MKPGLPPEFVIHWNRLVFHFNGSYRRAYRGLLQMWRSGADVPGYGTWRKYWSEKGDVCVGPLAACPADLPRGWSYHNLVRRSITQ